MRNCFLLFSFLVLAKFTSAQTTNADSTATAALAKDSIAPVEMKEVMPRSPYDFNAYLVTNLVYPSVETGDLERTGIVYVSFVVNKDSSISDVKVKKSSGYPDFDAEAVRVVSAMPDWYPGSIGGRSVRVEIIQPIRFEPPPKSKKKKSKSK